MLMSNTKIKYGARNVKKHISFIILSSLLISAQSRALTVAAKALVNYETKSNAVSVRNNEVMQIPHFEIPLNMLSLDFADRFPESIRKHLIFQKDGQSYVRWILNPEDTKWFLEIEKYFKAQGVVLEKKYYFTGYQTASRSYIVEDPNKEIQFSVKSSTNKTGGYWADKKQPVGEATDSRLNADFLYNLQKKQKFDNLIIMDEPAIMKIPFLDQAVVIRDLGEMNSANSDKIYVPGFSVLYESTGREIAAKNGSLDPQAFWTENYIKPVGRALGEFAARTGMQFDSPHSQNFLVELDSNYRPTGKIVLRDLADLYINSTFTAVLHPQAKQYFAEFSQKENIKDYIPAGFGPLHGNNFPSWVSDAQYTNWSRCFFAEFEKTFTQVSGLPSTVFRSHDGAVYGKYFSNTYTVDKDATITQNFWNNMRKYQTPRGILNCSYVMML